MDQDLRARYVQTVETINHELLTQDIVAKQAEIEQTAAQLTQLQSELAQLQQVADSANQTAG